MSDYKVIDLETWPRRATFESFRTFANPSFMISVLTPIGPLYKMAKSRGESFFLLSLYAILKAANEVPQLRQRFINGQVIEYNQLAASTAVMTPQEEFRILRCEYQPSFEEFKANAAPLIAAAKESQPAPDKDRGEDYIFASCVPWLHFTSGTFAQMTFDDAIPFLLWGKMVDEKVPISCRFNHCFVNGFYFSRFFNQTENYFTHPELLY